MAIELFVQLHFVCIELFANTTKMPICRPYTCTI
jgi:hypothetical protein